MAKCIAEGQYKDTHTHTHTHTHTLGNENILHKTNSAGRYAIFTLQNAFCKVQTKPHTHTHTHTHMNMQIQSMCIYCIKLTQAIITTVFGCETHCTSWYNVSQTHMHTPTHTHRHTHVHAHEHTHYQTYIHTPIVRIKHFHFFIYIYI